jgi:DMSO/TMAO reductase YedYZ molybdopterin-dependent catalytic subunit
VEFAPINRREFLLKLGGATATISLAGVGLGTIFGASDASETAITPASSNGVAGGTGRWSETNALPNANAAVAPAPGTRDELTSLEDHYRIDINTRSQRVDPQTWRLPITGLVDNPVEFTLDQLQTEFEPVHQFITLSCISNSVGGDLISTQRWTGARFSEVLARANPQTNAAYVRITAVDGFYEYVALDTIMNDDRIILCYHWDGVALPGEHGFPLRVYLPDLYGMKQPKWITGMELVENWEEGYWVARTWDEVARVQTTSVIDTIGVNDVFERDGVTYVPLGGIAYAGARGIQRVEVQINGGDWQEAQLRDPIAETTWVLWRYDLPFAEGEHTIAVRAIDGNGELQTDRVAPSHPSGATGIHTRSRRL